ncbi:zinc finger protein weckle-like [Uranotaenia lowii]|uniref:zinc finger protein weckle-like n=1 Tax=Uranotaenia lowii TaxID=190385 RepID=UPI00247A794C|nr:zinc finger protein weckle-like [Uranotaenia lowii]
MDEEPISPKLEREIDVVGPSFEEVVVKLDPDECPLMLDENTSLRSMRRKRRDSSRGDSPIQRKHHRHDAVPEPKQIVRQTQTRGVQVTNDELDAFWEKMKLKSTRITDCGTSIREPEEKIPPQCRFCLHRLPQSSLKLIDTKLRVKVRNALHIKRFTQDAFAFVCEICYNLVECFLNFRESIAKSVVLLANTRITFEEQSWLTPEHQSAIGLCKSLTEQHRRKIDDEYTRYTNLHPPSPEELPIPKREIAPYESDHDYNDTASVERADSANDNDNDNETKDEEEDEPVAAKHMEDSDYMDASDRLEIKTSASDNLEEADNFSDPDKYDDTAGRFDDSDIDDSDYEEPEPPKKKRGRPPKIKSNDSNIKSSSREKWLDDEDSPPKKKRGRKPGSKNKVKDPSEVKIKTPKIKKEPKPRRKLDRLETHTLCDTCGKTIHIHSKEPHMNQHLGIKPYSCPIEGCDLTFYGKYLRHRHVKRMHGVDGGALSHECDICGKIIRGPKSLLNQHKIRHAQTEKSHVCEICGTGFWMPKYLRRHMIIHTDLFPYSCQYCGKKFKHKASKDTHEKNVHEKKNNCANFVVEEQLWTGEGDAPVEEQNTKVFPTGFN